MRFKATDVFDYYKPSKCARRVALKAAGVEPQDDVSPFAELLRTLGLEHEASHLQSLQGVVNLKGVDRLERPRRTLDAIHEGAAAIYQPSFRAEVDLDGEACELVGEPDFLIRSADGAGYRIRDSKLARNVLSNRHIGIQEQLQIYGLLFELNVGQPPVGLEVHAGTDEIVPLTYAGEAAVLASLREHRRIRAVAPEAYEPVGWSKCAGCGYEDLCWKQAEAADDVALLTTIRQERARDLHERGISSIRDIAASIDDPAHRDYFWTGTKKPRHKDFVAALQRSAEAYLTKTDIAIAPPALPNARNFAMLDLEGLPQYIDDLDRIYLWGVKVFGDKPSSYLPAQSGFGPNGDREGWFAFLETADRLFAEYGPDLPFVHWGSYEKGKLSRYLDRHGDRPLSSLLPPLPAGEGRGEGPSGVAARVLANLVDLHLVTTASVVTPLPSYSLKVIEKHVGFQRRLPETNGEWSIARYIEATESADPIARAKILDQILAYNEEDLDANWAVMEWLRGRCGSSR